jgi:hypothetical protein
METCLFYLFLERFSAFVDRALPFYLSQKINTFETVYKDRHTNSRKTFCFGEILNILPRDVASLLVLDF